MYLHFDVMATPVDSGGGYDYIFVKQPVDMFVCKICHLPSRDPHLSMCCGHTFCKSCLENAKKAVAIFPPWSSDRRICCVCPMCRMEDFNTVPNKQICREVMGLHVFCTNKEKGCKWQGEINNISLHLKNGDGCQFENVKCFNACGMEVQRRYMTNHIENKCPQHVIECQYCKVKGKRRIITGVHIKRCPKHILPCPNALHGCPEVSIPREDICKHRKVCQYENVQCDNECGKKIQRRYLLDHVATKCRCRQVLCQYCQRPFEHWYLECTHIAVCNKYPLPCPNDCGTKDVLREDMYKHRKMCPLENVQCTNECGKEMKQKYLASHLQNECPRRLHYCQYCNIKGEHQYITVVHMTACDKVPLACPNQCDVGTVCRGDMDKHRKICPLETIDCEYHKVGCKVKMLRKDLEKHSEDNMKEHLLLTTKKLNETEDELRERVHTLETAIQQIINSSAVQQSESDQTALWPSHIQLASNLVANTPGEHVTPVIVKMSNYTQNKLQKKRWVSPPFYTHIKGYKMCLSVYANGTKNEGTYMSIFLCIMKGPYDDNLLWPLQGKFELKLLNQIRATGHYKVSDHLLFDAKANVCQLKSSGWKIGDDWGYISFISNENLDIDTYTCQYLKDDSVFFEVRYAVD